MPGILRSMAREEWRLHSSVFGGAAFAMFPALLAAFAFGFSLFIPMFEAVIPLSEIFTLMHLGALLFGVTIGGFALLGRELMNRRFGQASMVAYSARTLPVSERALFFNLAANDVMFYAALFILPFFFGYSAAALFTGAVQPFSLLLLSTLFLSFLMGMTATFFLSMLYVRAGKGALVAVLALLGLAAGSGSLLLGIDVLHSLPPLQLFFSGSPTALLISVLLIAVPGALALAGVRIEFPESQKRVANGIVKLSASLGRLLRDPHLVAKDMLDLHRSEGGIGKIVFSFILPLVMIWAMLFIFSGLFGLPEGTMFLIFSVLVGVLSSSIYNWLTEYDIFTEYAFLPVRVSEVMRAKLGGYALLNAASVAIMAAAALVTGQLWNLPLGLYLCILISAYSVSATVLICGLSPGILIFSGKVFSQYIILIVPVLVLSIIAAIVNPVLLAALVVLPPLCYIMLKKAFAVWDSKEQAAF